MLAAECQNIFCRDGRVNIEQGVGQEKEEVVDLEYGWFRPVYSFFLRLDGHLIWRARVWQRPRSDSVQLGEIKTSLIHLMLSSTQKDTPI